MLLLGEPPPFGAGWIGAEVVDPVRFTRIWQDRSLVFLGEVRDWQLPYKLLVVVEIQI